MAIRPAPHPHPGAPPHTIGDSHADVHLWAMRLEEEWGQRPTLVLACAGYADESWLAWRGPVTDDPDAIFTVKGA